MRHHTASLHPPHHTSFPDSSHTHLARRPGTVPDGPQTPGRPTKTTPSEEADERITALARATLSPSGSNVLANPNGLSDTRAGKPPPKMLPRPSWASFAAQPSINAVQPQLQQRIRSTRERLAASGFAPAMASTRRPEATAVYFGGVPRGPKGEFRSLLLAEHSLTRWALLGISFLGAGIAEIITHIPLADRLIAVMRLLGYRHLRQYQPDKSNPQETDSSALRGKDQPTRAATSCARRWNTEVATS